MSTANRTAEGALPLRVRKRERTRADVVAAVLRLLATREYAETTLEEIAAAAMVSRGTLFNHFGGKEGIILEWARQVGTELAGTVQEGLARDPSGALLGAVTRAMLTATARYPAALRALLGELCAPNRGRATEAREAFDLAAIVAPIIAAGQESGAFRADMAATELGEFAASVMIGAAMRASGPDDPEVAPVLHLLDDALAHRET